MMYMFPEAAGKLIAMERLQGTTSDFLPLIDPTFEGKPHLEQGATPEQVAALNPDVIIVQSSLMDELGDPLEELGFKVVYVDLETPEGYFRAIAAMGEILGDGASAAEIESFYRDRTDRVIQRVADEAAEPRVLVVRNRSVGEELTVEIPGITATQTMLVKIAGGRPVWTGIAEAESWTMADYEQIVAWDPQIILVVAFETDPESLVEELEEDPQWGALRAVRDGQLFGFPVDIYSWDSPDPRWILGLNWVVKKIHPDLFPEVDIVQEVIAFYEQMYRMDQAAIDEHIFSVLEGDF
jgi:iron complex transport system substrate-binding protein